MLPLITAPRSRPREGSRRSGMAADVMPWPRATAMPFAPTAAASLARALLAGIVRVAAVSPPPPRLDRHAISGRSRYVGRLGGAVRCCLAPFRRTTLTRFRPMTGDDVHSKPAMVARALAEVSRALTSSRESQDVLSLLLDRACTVLRAQQGMVISVGADERIRVIASRGLLGTVCEILPRHARDGLAMTAITERRAVWSRDVLNDPEIPLSPPSRRSIERQGYRAGLAAPLLADTHLLGALLIGRQEVSEFPREEVEVGEGFAALAALALEHRRFGAAEAARLRQDEALGEVERELLAELSADRLFPMILERAGVLVSARGTIYVAELGRSWLRRVWSTSPQSTEGLRFGEGVSGVCAETRRGVLVSDYPGWAKAHALHVALGVRTAIAQPLLSRGELLGVITMNRTGPDAAPFQPNDLAVLQRFARPAALALRNATLF